MGLGLNLESAGSGDIIPILKYDAKAGRMFRRDRVNGENDVVDITLGFKAVMDLENVEVGHINFATGGAPDFVMGKLGDPMPQRPNDTNYKQGFRIMLKLGKDSGGDIREFASNAKTALRGIDELHTAYEIGRGENAGKLPIVALKTTKPITTGEGTKKSTSYQPVFEIVGWANRPADLVFKPRARGSATNSAPSTAIDRGTPPTNGSTQVGAPAAKAAEPETAKQPEMTDADDFG